MEKAAWRCRGSGAALRQRSVVAAAQLHAAESKQGSAVRTLCNRPSVGTRVRPQVGTVLVWRGCSGTAVVRC